MRTCIHPDLKVRFNHTSAMDTIDELKVLFMEQVRIMKFECLNEFLSTMMEEKTCLEQHLVKMLDIHRRLTFYLEYWMTDELAVDVVLRLLPLSYKSYFRDFVMKEE